MHIKRATSVTITLDEGEAQALRDALGKFAYLVSSITVTVLYNALVEKKEM